MLEEISKYDELGQSADIRYILKSISPTIPITIQEVGLHCLYNPQYHRIPTNGVLAFLQFIGLVSEFEGQVILTPEGQAISKSDLGEESFNTAIVKKALDVLNAGGASGFIDFNKIKYDFHVGAYISNANIPLKYSGLRNLMIMMGFFYINNELPGILIVNEVYLDELQRLIKSEKKKLTLEALKRQMERQEELGLEAELFVLQYEKVRLNNNGDWFHKVIRISDIDVMAGYDIASFDNNASKIHNRFIEVKSYSKKIEFYWSKTEVEVARIKKNEYYLYLVNRDEIQNDGYTPIIIKNPFETVFLNDSWIKEAQEWFVFMSPP